MSLSKTAFIQTLPETAQITCLMMIFVSVAYSASVNSVRHTPKYVLNGSLQISFSQKLLGIEQTMCFIIIFMSVGHSLSFSSLRCITSSVHYESFENWIYSIVPGNS